jgi:trimeric autotransporter adhesin
MKTSIRTLLAALILLTGVTHVHAQGSAFTYQGRLTDSGNVYTGNAEFQVTLWDAASGGSQIAANSPAEIIVGVTNGLFVLPLDFGTSFSGAERWLQLEMRTTIGSYIPLSPRQPITPAPYAITAGNLTGTLPAAQLSGTIPSANLEGTYSSALTLDNAANSFSGSGAGLTALNASQLTSGTVPDARLAANVARTNQVWVIGGNAGTSPGTHFLGTSDNQALELKVNGTRVLRLEPTANLDTVNVIGGSARNAVGAGVVGATIGGGGSGSFNGVARTNRVDANFATVGGGMENTVQTNAQYATIGGGTLNTIHAYYATIGGGSGNTIQPNALHATVGGGEVNTIHTERATIGGGSYNTIQTNAYFATISGGWINTIQTNAQYATSGGGGGNTIQPNAQYATIPGGRSNHATNYAFAAGYNARATNTGAFVWSDGGGTITSSTNNNSVTMRARGGYRFFTGSGTTGAQLLAGATAWSVLSDRNIKKDVRPVDCQDVLNKLSRVPVSQWHYEWETESDPVNLGPMAQDFKAAFFPGRDDTSISTLEFDGVALAAIQGLNEKVEIGKQIAEMRIAGLEAENTELKQRLAALEQLVARINAKSQ